MKQILLLSLVAVLKICVDAELTFNNSMKGAPNIDCAEHKVIVNFETDKPFQGHVYIRGHYHDDDCHKDYILNSDNFGSMSIPFEKCGMRRQRMTNPKGMSMSATLITSFHRTFVTSMDKAYHINCFYMEADKEVTQSLDVSEIPTVTIGMGPPMPECKYDVLTGGPEGTPVRFARVGDRVYHKWSCKYEMQEMYCMIIHSCFVDDGADSSYEVIDDKGCSKDPVILEDLSYITDLMAGTEANVFKFADKSNVFFSCQVRLSLKHEHENEMCPRPQCNLHRRFRFHRQVGQMNSTTLNDDTELTAGRDFDLSSAPLLVLDLDDNSDARNFRSENGQSARLYSNGRNFCMSSWTFGAVVAATLVAILTSSTIIAIVTFRRRAQK